MLERFRAWVTSALGRDPLVPLALAGSVGIVVADRTEGTIPLIVFALLAIAAFFLAWKRPRWPGLVLTGTGTAFAFAHGVALWQTGQFPFSPNLRNGESIRLEATGLVVKEPDAPGAGRTRSGRCTIRFSQMKVAGITFHCDQRLPVKLTSPTANLRYGDRITTTGLLSPFDPPRTPGAFDPAAFFSRTLGAEGEFRVGSGDRIRILERDAGNPLIALALQSRKEIERIITRGLEREPATASVIKAMVLGSREDTPEHIEEQFRLAGAMHIFAVSGLHVGLFLAILWTLLRWLRVPRRYAIWILIPAGLFYAAVTGLRPSAIRAAVMATVVLLGFFAERKPRLLNSLGFAALLILAVDTRQLFLPGFQLSFAVLGSIVLFADFLRERFYGPWQIDPFLPRRFAPRWRRVVDGAAHWISNGLAVSLAAWAGSAWLVIYHFQLLTPIAIPANLVMVPMAFAVLGVAFGSLLLSLFGGGALAGAFLNPLNGGLVRFVSGVASLFASIPGGHVHFNPGTLEKSRLQENSFRVTVFEPTFSGLSQLWSFPTADRRTAHWLIDPGDPVGFASAGQPLLRNRTVNHLQALVSTHGDFDHIGAGALVVDRFRPGAVISSPFDGRSSSVPRLLESIERNRVAHLRVARGDRFPLTNDSTALNVLYPLNEETPPGNADDRSLVLQLVHHDWRILSTADSGFLTEKWLIENEQRGLPADVWIKGWHAGEISGLIEFLDRVKPRAVVTTHHEFPRREGYTDDWAEELGRRDIELFNLTELGAVEIEMTKDSLQITPTSSDRKEPLLISAD